MRNWGYEKSLQNSSRQVSYLEIPEITSIESKYLLLFSVVDRRFDVVWGATWRMIKCAELLTLWELGREGESRRERAPTRD